MTNQLRATAAPSPIIDWREVARAAIGSALVAGLIAGGFSTLAKIVEAEMKPDPARKPPGDASNADVLDETEIDDEEREEEILADAEEQQAAAALGVSVDATADEIRAALRARLGASRLHPDHGGDGEEAKRLIAAQNLLLARLRSQP